MAKAFAKYAARCEFFPHPFPVSKGAVRRIGGLAAPQPPHWCVVGAAVRTLRWTGAARWTLRAAEALVLPIASLFRKAHFGAAPSPQGRAAPTRSGVLRPQRRRAGARATLRAPHWGRGTHPLPPQAPAFRRRCVHGGGRRNRGGADAGALHRVALQGGVRRRPPARMVRTAPHFASPVLPFAHAPRQPTLPSVFPAAGP